MIRLDEPVQRAHAAQAAAHGSIKIGSLKAPDGNEDVRSRRRG
jgi:hypothetical protein